MPSWIQKAGGVVIGVVVILGMKWHSKNSASDETKAQLLAVCEGDAGCVGAVNQHFDRCFDDAYSMGGRRSSARLDEQQLATCLNTASGQPYFQYGE